MDYLFIDSRINLNELISFKIENFIKEDLQTFRLCLLETSFENISQKIIFETLRKIEQDELNKSIRNKKSENRENRENSTKNANIHQNRNLIHTEFINPLEKMDDNDLDEFKDEINQPNLNEMRDNSSDGEDLSKFFPFRFDYELNNTNENNTSSNSNRIMDTILESFNLGSLDWSTFTSLIGNNNSSKIKSRINEVVYTSRYFCALFPALDKFDYFDEDFTVLNNDTLFHLFPTIFKNKLNAMKTDLKVQSIDLDTIFSHESLYTLPNVPFYVRHSKYQMNLIQNIIKSNMKIITITQFNMDIIQNDLVYNERMKDAEYFHNLDLMFEYYGLNIDRDSQDYFLVTQDRNNKMRSEKKVNLSIICEQTFYYLYFNNNGNSLNCKNKVGKKLNNYRMFDTFISILLKNINKIYVEEILLLIYAIHLLTGVLNDNDSEHLQVKYLKLLKYKLRDM